MIPRNICKLRQWNKCEPKLKSPSAQLVIAYIQLCTSRTAIHTTAITYLPSELVHNLLKRCHSSSMYTNQISINFSRNNAFVGLLDICTQNKGHSSLVWHMKCSISFPKHSTSSH